jgi:hypothetical protein
MTTSRSRRNTSDIFAAWYNLFGDKLEASNGNPIWKNPMTTKVLRCDADTVAAVAGWGREHGGLSVSDAATILLAAALGRSKAAELNRAERDSAQGQGANGHAKDDEVMQEERLMPAPPVPTRPDPPVPVTAVDAATEALMGDAIERASWGLWPIETELLEACPGFILLDPPTTRARFMALIIEAEAHGFQRQTSSMTAFLLDRLQGRPGPAAMHVSSR